MTGGNGGYETRAAVPSSRDPKGAGVGIATYWGSRGKGGDAPRKNRDGYLTRAGSALKMCFIDWLGPL